jgi:hypothetical protein
LGGDFLQIIIWLTVKLKDIVSVGTGLDWILMNIFRMIKYYYAVIQVRFAAIKCGAELISWWREFAPRLYFHFPTWSKNNCTEYPKYAWNIPHYVITQALSMR